MVFGSRGRSYSSMSGPEGAAKTVLSRPGLIGSSEAASNRRLPPLEPSNPAPSWHVPLPVLTGPLREAARFVGRFSCFWGRVGARRSPPLREIRLARVGDLGVGERVDQRRPARGESS